jgi:hypothetical protein
MFGNFKTHGVYIKVSDMKKDGYYVYDDLGNLIHKNYEEPSTWDKMKFKMKFGYSMNTQTIITSYYCFSQYYPDSIFAGSILADGITVAKSLKKSFDFNSQIQVIPGVGKVSWMLDESVVELTEIEGGRALLATVTNIKDDTKQREIYSFLDWEFLN